MRKYINIIDRLRSFLTGRPARDYLTRRLAREDLHALEAERARRVARLTEDIELIDRYVSPLERYLDGNRLLTPLGTILDRRSGKNLPLVWTELDLREFPTASLLVFGFHGGPIQVRDLEKNSWHRVQAEFKGEQDHKGRLEYLGFLGSDKLMVGWRPGLNEIFIEVLDWKTGKLLFRVNRTNRLLSEPAASTDGRLMAFGDEGDGFVRLWDVRAQRELRTRAIITYRIYTL